MSLKITIIDNESGEILVNKENATAIIGAVTEGETTSSFSYIRGNGEDFMSTIFGVDKARDSALESEPIAKLLYGMKKLMPDEH